MSKTKKQLAPRKVGAFADLDLNDAPVVELPLERGLYGWIHRGMLIFGRTRSRNRRKFYGDARRLQEVAAEHTGDVRVALLSMAAEAHADSGKPTELGVDALTRIALARDFSGELHACTRCHTTGRVDYRDAEGEWVRGKTCAGCLGPGWTVSDKAAEVYNKRWEHTPVGMPQPRPVWRPTRLAEPVAA